MEHSNVYPLNQARFSKCCGYLLRKLLDRTPLKTFHFMVNIEGDQYSTDLMYYACKQGHNNFDINDIAYKAFAELCPMIREYLVKEGIQGQVEIKAHLGHPTRYTFVTKSNDDLNLVTYKSVQKAKAKPTEPSPFLTA